jgi:hypothetical protein
MNYSRGHELHDFSGGWSASSNVSIAHALSGAGALPGWRQDRGRPTDAHGRTTDRETGALTGGRTDLGRPTEPNGLLPTHPCRALGRSARGSNVGESFSWR